MVFLNIRTNITSVERMAMSPHMLAAQLQEQSLGTHLPNFNTTDEVDLLASGLGPVLIKADLVIVKTLNKVVEDTWGATIYDLRSRQYHAL